MVETSRQALGRPPQPTASVAPRSSSATPAVPPRKEGSQGSLDTIGTFYSSGHYRKVPVERVGLSLWKVCTFEIVGPGVPRTRSLRGLRDTGTSSKVLQHEAASGRRDCSAREAPGLGGSVPPWHACAVVKEWGSFTDVSTHRTPHTDSSVESSNGLMYSNPSNSDWSILLMTSLWATQIPATGAALPPGPAPDRRPRAAPRLLVVGGQLHGLAGELCVEVVQSVVVGDLRLEGRRRLLLLQLGTRGSHVSDAAPGRHSASPCA